MGSATFTYELGEHADRTCFLTATAEPGFGEPEEFAAVVHYDDPDEGATQVVRIDTAHGRAHFDRLSRRDEPKEDLAIGFWEAVERLEDGWRTYARGYERTRD